MKKNRSVATTTEPGYLRDRITQAMQENRYQHALELARQQFKYEPTPEHRDLFLRAQFGRAHQLRLDGKTRDAAAILQNALQTPDLSDEWKSKIATELAGAGDAGSALKLAAGAAPELLSKVLALAADAAVERDQAGKGSLPPELHADFERVLLAFKQQETGQDDAARQTLQDVSLRSAFLEWKLLLRGLLAYNQQDDVRALENWQRLDPERIPARLIAPFRALIDPGYRAAQSAAARKQLDQAARRLQGENASDLLRDLQHTMRKGASLAQTFRKAEQVASLLRRDAPHQVPKLARCMYNAILEHGEPEDLPRYHRVFGSPADDPSFHRLNAMALERSGSMAEAHQCWQMFEQEVARILTSWKPGDEATRVRALIWQHMGHNAATELEDAEFEDDEDDYFRPRRRKPQPLKPDAETCFRKAVELTPDSLDAHMALVQFLVDSADFTRAIEASRKLLGRFPDHLETLSLLGGLLMEEQQYAEALAVLQQALQKNPLDNRLRKRVAGAHTYNARAHAENGRFDEARAEYRASLAMDPEGKASVLCKWAACEFKARELARAEELLAEAQADLGSHLATAYSMLIETIRLGLPGHFKTRFNKGFNDGLRENPTPAAAVALAETTAAYHLAGVTYHGQKTHQKKVLDYLKKAAREDCSESQLEAICLALLGLNNYRLAQMYTEIGKRKYKKNPMFLVYAAENELRRQTRGGMYDARRDLEKARQVAHDLPPGREKDALLERIDDHLEHLNMMNPYFQMFGRSSPFGAFGFGGYGFGGFDNDDEFDNY